MKTRKMRLLLYNIRYGAGVGRRIHFPFPFSGYLKKTGAQLDRIADYIRDQRPDIVGLVEVDTGSFRFNGDSQVAAIAGPLCHRQVCQTKYGLNSIACRLPLLSRQANAVMTNRAILGQTFHYLNHGMKRLVIEVRLPELTLFLVHLALKYSQRQHQLVDLAAIVRDTHGPVVVAGDFNAFRGDGELEGFISATGLKSANPDGLPSHPSRAPHRQLDFIFHSPSMRSLDFQAPQVAYSDHVPLIWDFDFAGAERLAA
jgi:endonuclease/exonuclease/phosphatase family metal-dependent hydrolase